MIKNNGIPAGINLQPKTIPSMILPQGKYLII